MICAHISHVLLFFLVFCQPHPTHESQLCECFDINAIYLLIFWRDFLVHLTLTFENVFFQCGTSLLASAGGRFVIDTWYKQLM